jgi:hypothetical protein
MNICSFVVQSLNELLKYLIAWGQILCIQLKRVHMNDFGESFKLQVISNVLNPPFFYGFVPPDHKKKVKSSLGIRLRLI